MRNIGFSIEEAILPATADFAESISKHVQEIFFLGSIEGKVIGFTGNGPFREADLDRLAVKLKAISDCEGIDWGDLEWVVIGSDQFDYEYLEQAATVPYIRFFSQEEFLSVLLFGESSMWPSSTSEIRRTHEGLRFVDDLAKKGRNHQHLESSIPTARVSLQPSASSPSKAPAPTSLDLMPIVINPKSVPRGAPSQSASDSIKSTEVSAPSQEISLTADARAQISARSGSAVPPIPASRPPEIRETPKGQPTSGSASPVLNDSPPFTSVKYSIKYPDLPRVSPPETSEFNNSNLRVESELMKLGYSVKKGTIRTHRRLALQHGVDKLGLQNVINHLAWLVRFHRYKQSMYDAVARWQEDLEWLTRTHSRR